MDQGTGNAECEECGEAVVICLGVYLSSPAFYDWALVHL